MSNSPPRLLLADCDQMFVAVARLVDPEGAGRASLVVVGGAANSRGVVCSASYEVRAFGVRSGMPIAQAARLCPAATFVPVPRKACLEKSREVRSRLDRWAPAVEPASIDEFYLDLSGTEALYRHQPLAETARQIRADVNAATGLTLSLGGGTNRLVAKLAAGRAKPRPQTGGTGVHVVLPGEEATFLATHQLIELPGVGPRLSAKLRSCGLTSVVDALPVSLDELKRRLGPRTGQWLFARIRGEASAGVEPESEAKSMSKETTFSKDIADPDQVETELFRLTTSLTAELRAEGLVARCVTVKLRDDDFATRQASRTLEVAFQTDRVAFEVAQELLKSLRTRRRRPARLVGVGFSRFEPTEGPVQLSMLIETPDDRVETPRDRAVSAAVDRINQRFGREALGPARLRKPRSPS